MFIKQKGCATKHHGPCYRIRVLYTCTHCIFARTHAIASSFQFPYFDCCRCMDGTDGRKNSTVHCSVDDYVIHIDSRRLSPIYQTAQCLFVGWLIQVPLNSMLSQFNTVALIPHQQQQTLRIENGNKYFVEHLDISLARRISIYQKVIWRRSSFWIMCVPLYRGVLSKNIHIHCDIQYLDLGTTLRSFYSLCALNIRYGIVLRHRHTVDETSEANNDDMWQGF